MRLLTSFVALGLIAAASGAAAGDTYAVAPDLWDRPRSARAVLDDAAVRGAVGAYVSRPGGALVIHHPPGTVPALQAEELRAWLVALAVSSAHISLKSDLEPNARLSIEVLNTP